MQILDNCTSTLNLSGSLPQTSKAILSKANPGQLVLNLNSISIMGTVDSKRPQLYLAY
jgi:hypothetical protein